MTKRPICMLMMLLAAPALAQEEPAPDAPDAPDAPPEAPAVDRITLKNGETLQGELQQLKGGKLKLVSETVGKQTIELDKIAEVRSGKARPVVLKNGDSFDAVVDIDGDTVTLTEPDVPPRTITRAELASINPDPEKTELDYWKLGLTFGATFFYGNTRGRTAGMLGLLAREDDWTKLSLSYAGTYGQDGDDGENAKSHRGDAQFDIKITDDFYATPFVGHILYDRFQNIDPRYQIGAGVGYYLLHEDPLNLRVEVGGAYGVTQARHRPATPGKRRRRYTASVRAATAFHWELNELVTLDLAYECYIGAKDIQDTVHHGTGNLAIKLIKGVAFSVAGIYDRVERPIRGNDGKIPKKDDAKVIFGLSVAL